MNVRWLVLIISFVVCGFPSAWAAKVTLVYSGNLDGELEPCGCSAEGNLGGIRRQSTAIKQARTARPNLLFISSGGFLASDTVRDRLKSEYILKGIESLGYDALGLQWKDLAYGESFVKNNNLPWISSNWKDEQHFARQRVVERGGVKFAVFSWLDPAQSPMKQKVEEFHLINDDPAELIAALGKARAAGQTTVLTTTLPLKLAQRLIPLGKVDILLVRSGYEVFGKPLRVGKTLILQPGSRGMRLGQVELTISKLGRISQFSHKVISLPTQVADDPALSDWYQQYNDQVRRAYEAETAIKKQREAKVSPYVGATACESCHLPQHQAWVASKHSTAFERLEEVGKAFDPDCIGCHTVGFEKEGGFIDPAVTPDLLHVQCESCHGSGRLHVEAAGKQPMPNAKWNKAQICSQCHVPAHSPSFKVDGYWPHIAH